MSKFKKGDKVASVKTGAKGVVDEVYGEEKYAVLFDGAANPDRVEGFQIRLANSRACNAKFKIGEWVEFNSPGIGKRLGSVDEIKGDEYYIEDPKLGVTHIVKEKDIMRTVVPVSQTWGNSDAPVSANSVVRNAMAANARVARNDSVGEIAAEGISLSREALDKLKRAVPMIEKWMASGKGHPNAVADGKRLVDGIKKAVAILNPVV